MSSNITLRSGRALELLKQLKQTVAEFAKAAEQLSRDVTSRRNAIDRKYRTAIDQTEASLTAEIAATDTRYQAELERLKVFHQTRRERIQRIHTKGLRDLAVKAQRAKEKFLGELQYRHLNAERKLPVDLKAADEAAAKFAGELAGQEAVLTDLEKRARKAFGGYDSLMRRLRSESAGAPDPADRTTSHRELFQTLQLHLVTADEQISAFRGRLTPRFFSALPLAFTVLLILLLGVVLAFALGFNPKAFGIAGGAAGVLLLPTLAVYQIGLRQSRPAAEEIAATLARARQTHAVCAAAATAFHQAEHQRIRGQYDHEWAAINEQWEKADDVERRFARSTREKVETQALRVIAKNERTLGPKLQKLEAERVARLEALGTQKETGTLELREAYGRELASLETEESSRWEKLENDWRREVGPLYEALGALSATSDARFPAWDEQLVESWTPPTQFQPATPFGKLELDLTRDGAALPKDPRLALPGPTQVTVPLALTFPQQTSLLLETQESGSAEVIGTLNNVIMRLLATMPPGKVTFTIIDPVGLGQHFAGLMHLGDYEESLINRRIWTQRDQIEDRLGELNEHMEKVIQMYLRTEFETITEYNASAGSIAEKYHFVVVSDFPADFSETAAKRLQSIAASGPKCGVFTLIHWDQRRPMPDGLVPEELRKNSVCIRRENGEFILDDQQAKSGISLVLDPPPPAELAARLIHKVGQSSVDTNRVEVPFTQITPKPDEMWTNETANELRIPIGRTGATKLQYLAIGKGTRQHALFAGKTGSGKSTLFHVIVTNLALSCSPEQVEFYLIDFKKGVEFKCYAAKHLPHARVVAIESDREFGLSVLQRVDEELKRRGDIFRKLGVQDVAGYKRAGGTEPMPRTLLIIDEFQEFFVDDDAVAQNASLLFDRIVRQGRAFGIHVLLGSQTLGGAYTLARTTLGQMAIRVALQCNESDAYLIMDENNPAPRLLSRPGEGIYNDAAGAVEGNSPFQVVWLSDEEREQWLDKVNDLAAQSQRHYPAPIVFEGNAPSEIRENELLHTALETKPAKAPAATRCWLGAPNSIKGPTEAVFQRQSGNHLLMVGQQDEASLTLLATSLISLAAQYPIGTTKFVLVHGGAPGTQETEFIERVVATIPHGVTVSRGHDIAEVMADLGTELKERTSGGSESADSAPAVFLLIHGLQKFKKLRHEDDFDFGMSSSDSGPKPSAVLNDIIQEGSSYGMHILATIDTFNNVNRCLSRKALSEFEMRVVFQMSANDSASLIDTPKASTLGLHRAIFYNEQAGHMETFRPYAMPDAEWVREIGEKLKETHAAPAS